MAKSNLVKSFLAEYPKVPIALVGKGVLKVKGSKKQYPYLPSKFKGRKIVFSKP
jgi:hypothetical protein